MLAPECAPENQALLPPQAEMWRLPHPPGPYAAEHPPARRGCACLAAPGLSAISLVAAACLVAGVVAGSRPVLLFALLLAFVAAVLCLPGSSVLLVASVVGYAWLFFGRRAYDTVVHAGVFSNATLHHMHVLRR